MLSFSAKSHWKHGEFSGASFVRGLNIEAPSSRGTFLTLRPHLLFLVFAKENCAMENYATVVCRCRLRRREKTVVIIVCTLWSITLDILDLDNVGWLLLLLLRLLVPFLSELWFEILMVFVQLMHNLGQIASEFGLVASLFGWKKFFEYRILSEIFDTCRKQLFAIVSAICIIR